MTSRYAQHISTRATPQTEPIPGSAQVANSAGGYSFAIDDWGRLDRFLVLGAESGSFYASERKLTKENAQAVQNCLKADGARAVARIVEISEGGRAPKNDPAIFALALAASAEAVSTKQAALLALPRVCRIPTHLFDFVSACKQLRGRGRALHRALQNWYLKKGADSPRDLAYQCSKYQSRNGWSHRDLLRLCRPKATGLTNDVLHWCVKGWDGVGEEPHPQKELLPIWAFEKAKRATTEAEILKLVCEYDLVRECIPTQWLTKASIWEALLEKMPLGAMVRNLATMTRVGLLTPMSNAVGKVLKELTDGERIKKARLHPIALLAAQKTYAAGHGERSQSTWSPVQQVVDALDGAFYNAFQAVEPTGKRWLLALDVSGSMSGGSVAGVPGLTPRVASSAMALVTAAVESQYHFMAFSRGFVPLNISPRQRLDDVCKYTDGMPFDGTDCSLPMLYALQNKIPVDVFATYTDSETWAGRMHPPQALREYRQKMGVGAKMIVIGMVANAFTISDPNDAGSMDVVGFSTDAPAIMSQFAVA